MQIGPGKIPKARQLARMGPELSREAQLRLKWMSHYLRQGRNASFTCRHFGISRQSFYRWWRRYDPQDLSTLERRSHRPRRLRQATWTPKMVDRVLALRRKYPRWGKDKLVVLLHQEGLWVSTSMVGRMLGELKRKGAIREPLRNDSRRRRWLRARPYAVRKPKEYRAIQPGDLVQVDTLDVRPLPGLVWKHFTGRDVVSRWDVLQAHTRATAATATEFLDSLQQRMPFPIRAVQVDGGSEFAAEFEQACQQRGLHLFVLPPRSPKLNGAVERANRTHTEEFYQVTLCSLDNEKTQPRTAAVGEDLQHRASSS